MKKIILATGGTGGHIFPAQAIAESLIASGNTVEFIVDERFFPYYEKTKANFPNVAIHKIMAAPINGNPFKKTIALAKNAVAYLQAWAIMRHVKPDVVIGFGGYPSLPTMLAAHNYVRIIHEQNAVAGKANRLLCSKVQHIITGFAHVEQIPDDAKSKVLHFGNPVRSAILEIADAEYNTPNSGEINLLITGGSQAAQIFADIVPSAIAMLPAELKARLHVTQQGKAEQIEALKEQYAQMQVKCEIASFFTDIPRRLADAHLVIARAGASTIAEICASGRPAIFIPLPSSADNHQFYNAKNVSDVGGGWLLEQKSTNSEKLSNLLNDLFSNPHKLEQSAKISKQLAKLTAAKDLSDFINR
jgi:UDP-N-acetylglucosamine--N-acetylmuramyl-(pentapeptide) pyrophosphoryl-undecaprenol N-acetylglucosamine transferase